MVTGPAKQIRQIVAEKTTPRDRSEQEIAGYRDVLNTIHANHGGMKLTAILVKQLHRDLFKFTSGRGGQWKAGANDITAILAYVGMLTARLAGKNDKAVRQLELTYGGGKTHTLITMRHLVFDPANLPDLPAVREFTETIGQEPPKTRVAALCFDKIDVETGCDVRGPDGGIRRLKQPWSVLAYQIASDEGLKLLHAEGRADERVSPPAENTLIDLLSLPAQDGMGTLVLLDEVLLYAKVLRTRGQAGALGRPSYLSLDRFHDLRDFAGVVCFTPGAIRLPAVDRAETPLFAGLWAHGRGPAKLSILKSYLGAPRPTPTVLLGGSLRTLSNSRAL